jgi:hypothetical protein
MPAWNDLTIIAGVDFIQCQATIVDGSNRATDYIGSIIRAADATPHVQRVKTGGVGKGVGRSYGVNFPFADATLLQQVLDAIQAKEAVPEPFRVQMEDAVQEIDDFCWPDYDSGQWFTKGAELEGIIENVTLRFVSVAPYT